MTTVIAPDLSRAQLITIARTGKPSKGIGRMRALAVLQQRPSRELGEIFLEILRDKKELPRVRHMAAMGLYRLGAEQARPMLRKAARTADEQSAAPIAIAMGRIGEAGDVKVVERLATIVPGHARKRAEFAAVLLAYRHHLPDHRIRRPAQSALQELGRRRAREITFEPARGKAQEMAIKALAEDPLQSGIGTAKALRIECEPNSFLWLWAENGVASRLEDVEKEKGVAGVLLVKSEFDDSYSLSLIGLLTPSQSGFFISLHRPETGEIMYAGTADPDGSFELKARAWPGRAAVKIRGRATREGFEIAEARSAVIAQPAKVPRGDAVAKRKSK